MTTLAFDGTCVAADSLISQDGCVYGYGNKIVEVSGGILLTAGNVEDGELAIAWFNDGQPVDKKPELKCFCGLYVPGSGEPKEYNERLIPIVAPVPWAAGSGRNFALSAMMLGKSAHESVTFACGIDLYSGGEIRSVRVRG